MKWPSRLAVFALLVHLPLFLSLSSLTSVDIGAIRSRPDVGETSTRIFKMFRILRLVVLPRAWLHALPGLPGLAISPQLNLNCVSVTSTIHVVPWSVA